MVSDRAFIFHICLPIVTRPFHGYQHVYLVSMTSECNNILCFVIVIIDEIYYKTLGLREGMVAVSISLQTNTQKRVPQFFEFAYFKLKEVQDSHT